MASPAARSNGSVVLVVDDEDAVRRITARMLSEAGFRVLEAQDGEEAATLLSALSSAVRLVVADVKMPRMTGVELAGLMARQWPDTPVLLISGYSSPETGDGVAFLAKPFTADALLDAVEGLVALPKH